MPRSRAIATGHALTLQEPLRVDKISGIYPSSMEAWACSGTPSDTVKLALDALLCDRLI